MSALPQPQPDGRWSAEDYLIWERAQERDKHELINGHIVMMTGASREHNVITNNIIIALGLQLRGKPCEIYSADMRVQVRPEGTYTYPDVVVACGEPQFADERYVDTLLNPTLIVEVLSTSTELKDRNQKLAQYRELASLQDYLLVSQSAARIERYSRREDGWLYTDTGGLDATLPLAAIGCELALADVYARVTFEEGDKADDDD